MVCEEVENEYVLRSLKCNIHPLMMMQRKGKQLFHTIHDKIRINEINKCFMSMLISKLNLFHSKPLYVSHPSLIETFLQNCGIDKNILMPLSIQKNESLSLKDRRINRIFKCCYSLVHHMDDIKSYLEKFSSVFNGLSTIHRSFLYMEVLKFFVCTTSLIVIHITGPYQLLMINVDTSHDTLLQTFATPYQELNNIKGA